MSNNQNGKGDKPRNCFSKQFKNNYDDINWCAQNRNMKIKILAAEAKAVNFINKKNSFYSQGSVIEICDITKDLFLDGIYHLYTPGKEIISLSKSEFEMLD